MEEQPIIFEDLDSCWGDNAIRYFLELLNGEYDLEEAKSDLRSLIGSKYDTRFQSQANTPQ